MNIADLVTETLPEGLDRELSLEDVYMSEYDPFLTWKELEEARNSFPSGDWQRPGFQATLRLLRKSSRGVGQDLLLQLLASTCQMPSTAEEVLERALYEAEEDKILHSRETTLEYAQGELGERALPWIVKSTGVKEATVKRWMAGGKMAKNKYHRLCSLVLLYREALQIVPKEEVLLWMESKNSNGETPIERVAGAYSHGQRWLPYEGRIALQELRKSTNQDS